MDYKRLANFLFYVRDILLQQQVTKRNMLQVLLWLY